jgi:hypothetical protein
MSREIPAAPDSELVSRQGKKALRGVSVVRILQIRRVALNHVPEDMRGGGKFPLRIIQQQWHAPPLAESTSC